MPLSCTSSTSELPFTFYSLISSKALARQQMAACGSLQHIFEKPLPENPTLLESLISWNHIKPTKPLDHSSFTEIFGELHFRENPELFSSSSSSSSYLPPQASTEKFDEAKTTSSNDNEESTKSLSSEYLSRQYNRSSNRFSSMNMGSLQLCTEGLGFESSDDVEDLKADTGNGWQNQEERLTSSTITNKNHTPMNENPWTGEFMRKSRTSEVSFPPPISCIGKTGRPWVCFKSYREDGRFVLQEVRVPTQEILQARREDGRLKLQFFPPEDEEDELDEDEEEEEGKEDSDGDHNRGEFINEEEGEKDAENN